MSVRLFCWKGQTFLRRRARARLRKRRGRRIYNAHKKKVKTTQVLRAQLKFSGRLKYSSEDQSKWLGESLHCISTLFGFIFQQLYFFKTQFPHCFDLFISEAPFLTLTCLDFCFFFVFFLPFYLWLVISTFS